MFEHFGASLSGAGWGGASAQDWSRLDASIQDFYKALTGDGGSDVATLVGGSALRRESIEESLIVATVRPEHFVLWNMLGKTPARSLLHEFARQNDVSNALPGSSAIGETGPIYESSGDYERKTVKIKLLKDRRVVTLEAEIQAENGLGSAIARETNAGTLKLMQDAEFLTVYGDSACNVFEFDGLAAILEAQGGANVLDMRGLPISNDAREIIDSAQLIWDIDNWGIASDFICSGKVQKHLDLNLSPAHRVKLESGPQVVYGGSPIIGISTRFGNLRSTPDPFIQESGAPFIARGGKWAAALTGSTTSVVSSIAGVAGANAASKFLAAHAGNYYYGVQAERPEAPSALVVSAQVGVSAGDRVVVTITPPGANNAKWYRIFRGRKNGTNAAADLRQIARVPANGDNAVVYNDDNQNIPGTSIAFVITRQDEAIMYKRFAGMLRFPLSATTNTIHTWAQVLDIALQVAKPRQHRLIKNILPSGVDWEPF
ncbi:MAG: hypothetical protein SF182_01725 [Deltaproteobacteria bacterium]|nr:hypothetical protein [Deltaproteobacteria bacterium]